MQIPKQIHYCWFGGNEQPKLVNKCIETWQDVLPDYELIKWDESNFDVYSIPYTKEAYQANKWAFVSDYVRVRALYEHGGIYLDTDIEVLKKFDKFLDNPAFCGFESDYDLGSAVLGAKPQNKWIEEQISSYIGRNFIKPDGSFDMTTNSTSYGWISKNNHGLILNNTQQDLGSIIIYPKDYFCAKESFTGDIKITDNTVCIHHFRGSWHDHGMTFKHRSFLVMRKVLGPEIADKAYRLYKGISNEKRY